MAVHGSTLQAILGAALALAIAAPGEWCDWLCTEAPAAAQVAAQAPCHGEPAPAAPAQEDSQGNDCGTCELDLAPNSSPAGHGLDAGPGSLITLLPLAALPPSRSSIRVASFVPDRSPPRNILLTTSSLRL